MKAQKLSRAVVLMFLMPWVSSSPPALADEKTGDVVAEGEDSRPVSAGDEGEAAASHTGKAITFNSLTNSITVDSTKPPVSGNPNELYIGGDNGGGAGAIPFSKIKVGIGTTNLAGGSKLKIFDPASPTIELNSGPARMLMTVATCPTCFSTVAGPGDAIVSANSGGSEDLILAARNGNQGTIRFTTGFAQNCGFPGAESQKMVLTNAGNLGIGPNFTARFCGGPESVTQRLDVDGGARIRSLPLDNTLNDVVVRDRNGVLFRRDVASFPTGPGSGIAGSCASGANIVTKWSSPSAVTCSQIFDNGVNVGIGTTSPNPSSKVEIQYSDATKGANILRLKNQGGAFTATETGVALFVNTVDAARIYSKFDGNNSADARLTLQTRDGFGGFGDDTLSLKNMAVGIGTIDPNPTFISGLRLSVAGKVRVDTLNGAGSQSLCRDSNNILSACGVSDARLKSNIVPLTHALDKLSKIKGVTFDWNEASRAFVTPTGRREIGVLAQDVEAVFPELVSDLPEGYKAVDYSKLTAVLIEAVKELKAANQVLRQRIEALEKADGK